MPNWTGNATAAAIRSEAFYLARGKRSRFCLLRLPELGVPKGCMVYLHPFAEEMNKARRMAALAAHALAKNGWAVLQIDLAGCGDSSGDFGDARWESWIEDSLDARAWLSERFGHAAWLWGLRAGCLLATESEAARSGAPGLLLWQPVISGRQHLQQFLRLKVAGEWMSGSANGAAVARQLKERFAAGEAIEIAGYEIAAPLALTLEQAELRLSAYGGRVVWLEVTRDHIETLSPAAQIHIDRLRENKVRVDAAAVEGPPFWHTVEIAECPHLVEATLDALKR